MRFLRVIPFLAFIASLSAFFIVKGASVSGLANTIVSQDVKIIKRGQNVYSSLYQECGQSTHCAYGAPEVRLYGAQDGSSCPCSKVDDNGYGRESCQYPTVSVVQATCVPGCPYPPLSPKEAECDDTIKGSATIYFGEVYSYYTAQGAIYLNWQSGSAPGGDYTQSSTPGDDISIKCSPF